MTGSPAEVPSGLATLSQQGIDLPGGLRPVLLVEARIEVTLLGEVVGGLANHGLALGGIDRPGADGGWGLGS